MGNATSSNKFYIILKKKSYPMIDIILSNLIRPGDIILYGFTKTNIYIMIEFYDIWDKSDLKLKFGPGRFYSINKSILLYNSYFIKFVSKVKHYKQLTKVDDDITIADY